MIQGLYDSNIIAYDTTARQMMKLVLNAVHLIMKREKKRVVAELQLHSDQDV